MATPKPQPTEFKKLKGTLQKCRTNKHEPKVKVMKTSAPAWLSPTAKEAYQELSELLVDMKVLAASDRTALAMLCDAYAEYREARDFIKEKGMTYITTSEGGAMHRAYPQVAIASDAYKRVRSMMTEFGLTPSSRSKVAAQGEEVKDPFEEFLNAKKKRG
jgi:P27 family predicted phage terminase small subunit